MFSTRALLELTCVLVYLQGMKLVFQHGPDLGSSRTLSGQNGINMGCLRGPKQNKCGFHMGLLTWDGHRLPTLPIWERFGLFRSLNAKQKLHRSAQCVHPHGLRHCIWLFMMYIHWKAVCIVRTKPYVINRHHAPRTRHRQNGHFLSNFMFFTRQ